MSHKIKDGYHIIYGWEFTVKDGRVYHAMRTARATSLTSLPTSEAGQAASSTAGATVPV